MTNDTEGGAPAPEPEIELPSKALKAVRAFVGEHGGTGSAVVQPIGRVGTRLTLVGGDGVLGDQVVDSAVIARAIVDAVEGLTEAEWDRELVSAVNPAPGHWAKMAGWVAGQSRFPKARNNAIVG